jgi:hypothetical protein
VIVALLAAGLLAGSEPVMTPDQLAEAVLTAGACEGAGWQAADDDTGNAFIESVARQHPGMTFEQFGEALMAAVPAARERIFGGAVADRDGYLVWADDFARRCDALAVAHPLILQRRPDTDARWAEERAQGAANRSN